MTGVIDWAVRRARMMIALALLCVGAGVAAYVGLPKEGTPNIDIPVLYVSVILPGVSAADSERLIVKPLESKLRGLEGLEEMTGIAAENRGSVLLEFDFGWDPAATKAEVRALVDEARAEMPDDALEPKITEVNLSEFPILVVALSGEAPERTLQRLGKDMQRELESLRQVLEVGLAGEREEMVEVVVDPLLLESYDVTAPELLRIVGANNSMVAAGSIESAAGRFAVRVPGNFASLQEILNTPVRADGDRVVTIGDLAEIRRTFEDAEGTARFNGNPAVALQVKKRLGENILDTVETVKARVEEIRAGWPPALRAAVSVDYAMDESRTVVEMVDQLEGSVALAVALVMLVVIVSLGARSSLLVGMAIPLSFLLSFALLAAFGMTVNNMVMFGLILAVGMLVDGAIVVSELADVKLAEGAEPETAYAEAAKRMFWPIASSTATTLSAFLPMLFWPGMPGKFMGHLPVTLIFVLSASMIAALLFLPVIGGVLGRASATVGRALGPAGRAIGLGRRPAPAAPARRRTAFGAVMSLIVKNPVGPVVAIALSLAAVGGVIGYYAEHNNGVEFFVDIEPERGIVYVRARGNLSLAEKDRLVREVEARVLGVEGVRAVFAFAGAGGLDTAGGQAPQDAIGQLQLELEPWGVRPPGGAVFAEIRERASAVPGVIIEVQEAKEGPEQGKPIQLRLESGDWPALLAAAGEVRALFESVEGLTEIDDTRPLPGIDWEIAVDREAAGRFGADVDLTGMLVQLVTRGALLDTIRPDDSDDEIDIRVRFPPEARGLSTLESLKVRTEYGLVPIRNFVEIRPTPALAEITRFDGQRYLVVKADVAPGVNANARIAELRALLEATPLPGVETTFQGDQEEQAESMAFLQTAYIGALGLMFAILLAQFNSLYNALLVLSAVVLSITGALIGMLVMGQPFSIIMTGTGVVALAGIVVNNNIVLIDTYRELSASQPPLEAILRAAESRIRPVLLTTITTMAGLAPMMFTASIDLGAIPGAFGALLAAGPFSAVNWTAFGAAVATVGAPAALWWTQLATAVVFGLGVATVLTLMVTPSALALRVWFWRGVAALVAVAAPGDGAAERRLRRRVGRLAPPEILWETEEPQGPPRLAYPPRNFSDAAE
jgi:multidrug efflux pump